MAFFWMQYRAALRKNYLNKRRNARVTFYEMFSPLFLIYLLYYGYQQSEIYYIAARNYAEINLSSSTFLALFDGSLQGDGWYSETAASTENDALTNLRALLDTALKGPLPAPTFDQYVLASSAVSSLIDDELYNELLGQTEFGQAFGNLVTLGTVHVTGAPGVPEAFDAYMRNTSVTWGRTAADPGALFGFATNTTTTTTTTTGHHGDASSNHYFRVRTHASERDAVKWIDRHAGEERAWVLIVFDALETGKVDYTLRFNYTTVPHTAYLVNWISIGLDERYQRYYLSGFYSVSAAVDAFAFNFTGARPSSASMASGSSSSSGGSFGGDDVWLRLGGGYDDDVTTTTTTTDDDEAYGAECKPPTFVGAPFPTAPYEQNL